MAKNEDVTEEYYVINNSVKINKGKIINNRFFKELNISKVGQWMIINRELVTRAIKKLLGNEKGVNADDCFEYGLFYYLNSPEKMFKKNYHGEDTDYAIENYIMGRNLKFMVRSYKSDVKKKNKYLEDIVTADEKEASGHGGIVEDRDLSFASNDFANNTILLKRDREDLDNKYIHLLKVFIEEIKLDKYVQKIDGKELFDGLFLNIEVDDPIEHFKNLAIKLGVSDGTIAKVREDLMTLYKEGNIEVQNLYKEIAELMEAHKNGWDIPYILK